MGQAQQLGGAAAEGLVTQLLKAGVFVLELANQGARAHVQTVCHGIEAGLALALVKQGKHLIRYRALLAQGFLAGFTLLNGQPQQVPVVAG